MVDKKHVIMVSSTVYGIEELLERVYSLLTSTQKYDVWMSHKGTMFTSSDRSAFENCLDSVEKCDLFLGFITPYYGTGKDEEGYSITHREQLKAISLNKPRWFLVHDHVVFARSLLNDLGYQGKDGRKKLSLKKDCKVLNDLRVIDMYEDVIQDQIPLKDRKGNWVQKYLSDDDVLLHAVSQFFRYQEVEDFIQRNIANYDHLNPKIMK